MRKVLIVDDEPDILLMLRVNLESEGYSTALAADGKTALRRVREERPDLVLLDVMMPVMDGWAVLEALSADSNPPRVIMVSAKSTDRDVVRAMTLNAADYLTKPFDPERLIARVGEILGQSRRDLDAHRLSTILRHGGAPAV